jgi:hypothetical protein
MNFIQDVLSGKSEDCILLFRFFLNCDLVSFPIFLVFHQLTMKSKSEKAILCDGWSAFTLPEGTKIGILDELVQDHFLIASNSVGSNGGI